MPEFINGKHYAGLYGRIKRQSLFISMLLPLMASADAIEINGIYYNLKRESKTAGVTQNPNKYSGDVVLPEEVTYEDVVYSVNYIDNFAFEECTGLTSVTIPNSITIIGSAAFEGCMGLTSIKIPQNITEISDNAFYDCNGLTSVHISDLEAWCKIFFAKAASNPLCYAHHLFLNGMEITDLVIPSNVTTIKQFAFNGCSGIITVTIPKGVTSFGEMAFNNCSGLTSVTIPSSLTSLKSSAFRNCSNLKDVYCCSKHVPTISIGSFEEALLVNATLHVPIGSVNAYKSTEPWKKFKNIVGISSSRTIHVETAGTLSTLINKGEEYAIEQLTLTGEINGDDFKLLRNMAGKSSKGQWIKRFDDTDGLLSVLDLSGVKIVAGGCYMECGNADNWREYVVSNDNEIPPYIFNDCSGLRYINIPNSTVSICDNAFQGCSSLTDLTIPSSVITLGAWAFGGCSCFTSVTIPNSVNTIGEGAFSGCSGLKSFIIPNNVTIIASNIFKDCTALTSITVPNSIKYIGSDAFSGCSSLSSITIPSSVISIYEGAFKNCSALSSVFISDLSAWCGIRFGKEYYYGNQDYANPLFYALHLYLNGIEINNLVIPDDVTSISAGVFTGFNGLASVTIPSNVSSIGNMAFSDCSNLTTITFPDHLVSIGYKAFDKTAWFNNQPDGLIYAGKSVYCYKGEMPENTEIVIENGTLGIAHYAFSSCNNLTSVTIPPSLISINRYAFEYCHGLKSVHISDMTAWCNIKFEGYCDDEFGFDLKELDNSNPLYLAHHLYLNGEEIKDLVIPSEVSSISDFAFIGCSLSSLSIPESVTSVGELAFAVCENLSQATIGGGTISRYAFAQCPNLKSLRFGDAITHIIRKAFYNCRSLSFVTLGRGVSSIGYGSFDYCKSLTDVFCYADIVPKTDNFAFSRSSIEDATLHVLEKSVDAYLSVKPWSDFKYIVEIEGLESITISSAKQVTYMSDKNLNFTVYPDLKAYVATGYDKSSGTIWLTRVKDVPAMIGFLLMGNAGKYDIPVTSGGSSSYYQNLFKGTIEGTTIQTAEGDNTNYYLSNGDAGVGFYKVTKAEGQPIGANRAYLSVPTEIPAVGTAGNTETIKVSAAGQVPYFNSESLDFSSLDAQGVKAYTATGYDYSSGTIWLTRVKQVPAETGILIMAPQGEYPVPTASVASVYANMFKGTLTGTTIQTHETIAGEDYINYYLSSGDAGVGFYKVTKEGGVTIGANRCYLPIKNQEASAGTRSAGSGQTQIAFEEADEVIGIPLFRGVEDDNDGTTNLTPALSKGEGEGDWYTLQGQRVAKPGKGIYIRNGKKVVIK